MPVLTKEVEVKINSKTVKYYESLGYDIPMKKASDSHYKRYGKEFMYDFGKTIVVDTNDLTKGSNIEIEVLCDSCMETVMTVPYYRYKKSFDETGSYVCKHCIPDKRNQTLYNKYGVYNPSQVKEFREKAQRTMLELYGKQYYAQTEEYKEKKTSTMQTKYGVSHNSQLPDYREKYNNTCKERYGEFYNKQFAKIAFETFRDRTGYNYPSQSPEVREKIIQSYIEHYGVDHPNKSPEVKQHIAETNLVRYGFISPSQSPEIRNKMVQTLYENGTTPTSKQQLYIFNLYNQNNNVKLNFPISHFNIDICFPEEKIAFEYDGGFHDGVVKMGNMTQEEFDHKELIRDKIIKSEGYKIVRVKSSKDFLPSDSTLLQMLQDTKSYFSQYPNHSWIEFSIDFSTVRNAENPQGLPYSFGELRTIKESDIK